MPNLPIPLPPTWNQLDYDLFMLRLKQFNSYIQGTGSVLQSGFQVTQFPDASIDANAIKAGSLLGDFKVANGSIASRDYSKLGTGWRLNSDGTVDGIGGTPYANFSIFGSGTSVITGNGRIGLAIPVGLNGNNLTVALAIVSTKGVTGTTNIMVRRSRNGSDIDMLSMPITIGDEYYALDGVIDTSNDDIATGDMIYVDVDAVHITAPVGLSVILTF